MYRSLTALGAATLLLLHTTTSDARPITLPEALAAVDRSPALGVAAANVDVARAGVEQAGKYNYNPALGVTGGAFRGGRATLFDIEVGISQAIELGGKRRARVGVARAERDAVTETLAAARNNLRADVRRAFLIALVAQSRIAVTTENEIAARQLREAASERLRLGAATQTELNVAIAALGRAIAAKQGAERDLLLARQALGDALGVAGTDLEPVGTLPTFQPPPTDESRLVTDALAARRDLAAIDRTRLARDADIVLADALAKPDPELSVAWARSAVDGNNAVIVGVRVELPLWNRNQGNRAAARAGLQRATIELGALRNTVEREVRTAVRRYRVATEAVAAFDQQVVGSLAENLKLAHETLAAGKLGLLEVNAVRRDLVDSQLTYLDAITEAVEARAALERATGRALEGTP